MGIDTNNILGRLNDARSILGRDFDRFTGEPQRNYQWEIAVLGREANGTFLDTLKFYAKSVTIPQESINLITTYYMGNQIQYPGSESTQKQFQMVLWDDELQTVYMFMKKWKNLLRETNRGRSVSKKTAVSDILIKLKDRTDLVVTAEFSFTNCFPFEIAERNLNYDASEVAEVAVSFTFDDIDVRI